MFYLKIDFVQILLICLEMWRFLCSTNRYNPRNRSNGKETTWESNPQFWRAPRSLQLQYNQVTVKCKIINCECLGDSPVSISAYWINRTLKKYVLFFCKNTMQGWHGTTRSVFWFWKGKIKKKRIHASLKSSIYLVAVKHRIRMTWATRAISTKIGTGILDDYLEK